MIVGKPGGVATRRTEFTQFYNDYWKDMEAILSGSKAVKRLQTRFLPMPNASDKSETNKARYKAYLRRAVFFPLTKRTLEGYLGLVFYKDPEVKLPSTYDYMRHNVDGQGRSINEQAMQVVWDSLGFGRAAIAVDYTNKPARSVEEEKAGNDRVEFLLYRYDQIINWRHGPTGSGFGLTLVVFEEDYVLLDDGYITQTAKQQIEWRLDGDGLLVVKIWRGMTEPYKTYRPTKHTGARFDYIPVAPHGPRENTFHLQEPPMMDLGEVNIAHYRNSADQEESSFAVGQPTYLMTGLTQHWVNENMNGKIEVGSKALIPLPTGADGKILQPDPNTMAAEGMKTKETQMAALGAKNLVSRSVERSASEAGTDHIVDNSVLGFVIRNVNSMYAQAFRFASDYTGTVLGEEETFELNTDYEARHLNPQEQQQLVANWQAGILSREEVRWSMRRGGIAYQTDEKALTSIEKDKELRLADKNGNQAKPNGNGPGDVEKFQ